MDDTAEVVPVAPPPASFPLFRATTDASVPDHSSRMRGKPVHIHRRSTSTVCYARYPLSLFSRTTNRGCVPVITRGLGEWEDISPVAGAEGGVHQQVNVYRRMLLESVIEPCGQVHGSL